VFTRYWLHNTGPAPIGYLPVSVHLTELAPDRFRVTVAASVRPARGSVGLDVPAGLTADSPALDYDLAPGEHAEFTVTVRPDPGAAPGTYYLAARIRDDLGQLLEDALPVTVGAPTAEPLRAELTPHAVRLTNHARSGIRGEVQLISPYGTWGGPGDDLAVTPRTQGFAVGPGETAELPYAVRSDGNAASGGRWWVLAKVSAFGTVQYTEALPLTADGRCRSTG
jgi:hypothetical protein